MVNLNANMVNVNKKSYTNGKWHGTEILACKMFFKKFTKNRYVVMYRYENKL